jgi:hypothetical protein
MVETDSFGLSLPVDSWNSYTTDLFSLRTHRISMASHSILHHRCFDKKFCFVRSHFQSNGTSSKPRFAAVPWSIVHPTLSSSQPSTKVDQRSLNSIVHHHACPYLQRTCRRRHDRVRLLPLCCPWEHCGNFSCLVHFVDVGWSNRLRCLWTPSPEACGRRSCERPRIHDDVGYS